eukprot:CAMPEP_0117014968 /NCGR_PEP_ID=MMETSP0472-20121206/12040_1 /TAXON_ID=693140 ORGANISM="Tiarina fusus, Strain LIS" /NCGR_SAMPLE_ID=MMETSP0472 /ASSEMBLY_ACC=CAM_ASM_000603 /LENGTH=589 /DNA_ID=CAMNT_0004718651 /DNA_START=32 /DNA_END=1801 /DNA_ORIENTATION=+
MKFYPATILLNTIVALRQVQARIGEDRRSTIRELSGAASSVLITEIMYNPIACSDGVGEWIELFNNGSSDVDIGGWTIGDSGGGTSALNAVVLSPGDYYILGRTTNGCGNLSADQTFGFALNNSGGDTITLTSSNGDVVDTYTYSDIASAGRSIQRKADSSGHPTTTWEPGTTSGGTPRSGYTVVVSVADVKITEIMYNPSGCSDGSGEWIELYNAGSASASLRDWSVQDNSAKSVTLGDVDLAPQEYYILARTIDGCGDLNANRTFTSFTLNNYGGDTVYLYNAAGNAVDSHAYTQHDASEGNSIERKADISGNPTSIWVEGPAGGTPRRGYSTTSSPAAPPPSGPISRKYQAYELELECGASAGYAVRFTYELVGPDLGNQARPSSFYKDGAVPNNCQQLSRLGYSHPNCGSTGRKTNEFCFDRGHLVMANHLDNDAVTIFESNMMTNILPQAAGFNQAGGAWIHTENIIECSRDLGNIQKQVVFGGALFSDSSNDYFLASHGIPTPETFWKVLIRYYTDGTQEVLSWLLPNHYTSTDDKMSLYISRIAAIQALTGDAMPELPTSYTEITDEAAWDNALSGCDKSRR